MSRACGRRSRARAFLAAPLALAALALLAGAAAATEVALAADLPLIPPQAIDLGVGADGVAVDVETGVLPPLGVELPGVRILAGEGGGREPPSPATPEPAATPADLATATGMAAGQAAGAAALGAAAVSAALPWESLWAAVSNGLAQARESARPALRPIGRLLRALPFALPLFSRLASERLLENPVRARVHEAVAQDPGLSLQDVRDRAGIAWGTTVHHLARLERHGLVVSVRHGNHRRWFPANTVASRHRRELAALAHPTARAIAAHVAACPGTDQKGLCRALDLQNPAASKHLGRFERLGLVEVETVGRSRLYHPTQLLRDVQQTLAGLGPMQAAAPRRAPLRETLPEAGPLASPDVALAT